MKKRAVLLVVPAVCFLLSAPVYCVDPGDYKGVRDDFLENSMDYPKEYSPGPWGGRYSLKLIPPPVETDDKIFTEPPRKTNDDNFIKAPDEGRDGRSFLLHDIK